MFYTTWPGDWVSTFPLWLGLGLEKNLIFDTSSLEYDVETLQQLVVLIHGCCHKTT